MKMEQPVVNKSGLHPVGKAVLVRTYEVQSSIIAIPDFVKDKEVLAEQRAEVIEIGPLAWDDSDGKPRFKVGDKVLFTKFSGYVAVGIKDGVSYRVVNSRDIFLRLEEDD